MKELTNLEEIVMMAIWKLDDNAYGVKIKKRIKEMMGTDYFYNTLYTVFEQLVRKGYLQKRFGEPEAVRGGKRKVLVQLKDEGLKSVKLAYQRQQKIWDGVSNSSFIKNYGK